MPNPTPRRGDIYWIDVPKKHTVGSEQYKRRPWLVISSNLISHLPIVIGVPLSQEIHKQNRQHRILILEKDIVRDSGCTLDPGERIALTEQVRVLSVERVEFPRQGRVTATALYAVEGGVAYVLDIH